MAIKYIDTNAKELKVKKEKEQVRLKLFLKTVAFSFAITFGFLLLVGIILGLLVYPKAKNLSSHIEKTYAQAKKVQDALENKDVKLAEREISTLQEELKTTRAEYKKLVFLKVVPIAAGYYNDGEHLLNASDTAVDLGNTTLEAIDPFADILGLEKDSPEATAEQKAQTIVKEVIPKLLPLVDKMTASLEAMGKELDEINPEHYPEGFEVKGVKVRENLILAKASLKKANDFIPEVKPLLLAAPELAGEPDEKTYLILLQNDKELRPTGGFITAYALVKVKGGRIVSTDSDDIYKLDQRLVQKEIAPDAVRKYIGHTYLPIRDSNISPDYKVSAEKFESIYNTIKNVPKVDGVLALDTEFVRSILEVTGPVKTKQTKEVWSAEKNRLGIPDVVYKLELYAEKINRNSSDRKGVVGELMDAMIDKVMNVKPNDIGKYLDAFIDTANRKHILFYFHNATAQKLVEKYNYAGRIKEDYDGDYFHLNNSNFGGLKGNLYLQQKVVQNIQISPDGEVTKSVDVTLINPVKADGWLNSIMLNWMRVYVPKGSSLISKKVYKDFTSGVEFDKEVYRGYGPTYPLNSSTFNFTYKLPFKIIPGQKYKMLIQKQAGVGEIDMKIRINNVTKEEFKLKTDKELILDI